MVLARNGVLVNNNNAAANGCTWGPHNKNCYAEYHMTSYLPNSGRVGHENWTTCLLPEWVPSLLKSGKSPTKNGTTPCVDGPTSGFKAPYSTCASNKEVCNDPKYATMLKNNCPKTCGVCGTERLSGVTSPPECSLSHAAHSHTLWLLHS